jgi:hypothetical protein
MRGLAYQQAESIFRQPPPHMSVCLEFPFERPATPYGARTPTVVRAGRATAQPGWIELCSDALSW